PTWYQGTVNCTYSNGRAELAPTSTNEKNDRRDGDPPSVIICICIIRCGRPMVVPTIKYIIVRRYCNYILRIEKGGI
ncbi:MAG: hypothetical protein IKH75_00650, partial [Ruminococcus sp.]|nr:hypothetical protein [Ruminococcus sp.]